MGHRFWRRRELQLPGDNNGPRADSSHTTEWATHDDQFNLLVVYWRAIESRWSRRGRSSASGPPHDARSATDRAPADTHQHDSRRTAVASIAITAVASIAITAVALVVCSLIGNSTESRDADSPHPTPIPSTAPSRHCDRPPVAPTTTTPRLAQHPSSPGADRGPAVSDPLPAPATASATEPAPTMTTTATPTPTTTSSTPVLEPESATAPPSSGSVRSAPVSRPDSTPTATPTSAP